MNSIDAQRMKEIRDNTKQLKRIANSLDVIVKLLKKRQENESYEDIFDTPYFDSETWGD